MVDPTNPPRPPHTTVPSGPIVVPKPPPTYSTDRDVHLLDRLAVLYRYRRVSGAVFVLTALALMIQSYSSVIRYEAQARLLIEEERTAAMPGITSPLDAYWEDPIPYYNTQYRILRGRELARRVIRKLQLQNVAAFDGSEPPVPARGVWLNQAYQRTVALVRRSRGQRAVAQAHETSEEAVLISALLSRVRVVPVIDSRLVDVHFQGRDPAFAAIAANALVDEYVTQNLEVKQESTQNMLQWLEGEVASQQAKVVQSERDLAAYRDRENAMSLDDKNNIVVSRLNALNEAVLKARTVRIEKEAIYKQIKSATAPETIPVIAHNPQINVMKQQLAELQREKARLTERYLDKHPEVGKINAQLADTQRQIDLEIGRALQTVSNEYERGLLEERTLRRQPRGSEAGRPGLEPPRRQLQRPGPGGAQQSNGLRSAAAAPERAPRVEQQPRQQCAGHRACGSAAGADHADRPAHLAPFAGGRSGGRRRDRLRTGLFERHHQNARRHCPPSEAGVPRLGAGRRRRQAPAACVRTGGP